MTTTPTTPISFFDLSPREITALHGLAYQLMENPQVLIGEAFKVVELITQSEGLTVEQCIKFLSENLFLDLEISHDGLTFGAKDVR